MLILELVGTGGILHSDDMAVHVWAQEFLWTLGVLLSAEWSYWALLSGIWVLLDVSNAGWWVLSSEPYWVLDVTWLSSGVIGCCLAIIGYCLSIVECCGTGTIDWWLGGNCG